MYKETMPVEDARYTPQGACDLYRYIMRFLMRTRPTEMKLVSFTSNVSCIRAGRIFKMNLIFTSHRKCSNCDIKYNQR